MREMPPCVCWRIKVPTRSCLDVSCIGHLGPQVCGGARDSAPSVQKRVLRELCRRAQSSGGDKKQQVKIDWALHNGLRPVFIDCMCLLLCIFGSVLAPLMLTCVTCQNWFKENLLRSVGRPFCVHEFLPLFCDVRFDLTVKQLFCATFFPPPSCLTLRRLFHSHLRRLLVPTSPLTTPNWAHALSPLSFHHIDTLFCPPDPHT